jgi:hypothetical protein
VDFCNKKECRTREFGIGKSEGYFSSVECGQLHQFKTSQPYYEWEVKLQGQEEFKRLRFRSEDEIIKQDAFLRLCMRELYELPSKLKSSEWFIKVNQALKEVKVVDIEIDDDTSPFIILRELIRKFVAERSLAQTKDQINSGRAYYSKSRNEYLFRIKDLMDFVFVQKQFRHFTPSELHGIIRELGGESITVRTESKKQIRCCAITKKALGEGMSDNPVLENFEEYLDKEF